MFTHISTQELVHLQQLQNSQNAYAANIHLSTRTLFVIECNILVWSILSVPCRAVIILCMSLTWALNFTCIQQFIFPFQTTYLRSIHPPSIWEEVWFCWKKWTREDNIAEDDLQVTYVAFSHFFMHYCILYMYMYISHLWITS